ncbi:MAG: hypothetical protein WC045_00470 [Patescibacteria group bacterium]
MSQQLKNLEKGINFSFVVGLALILIAPLFNATIHLQSIGVLVVVRLFLFAVTFGHRESLMFIVEAKSKSQPKKKKKR